MTDHPAQPQATYTYKHVGDLSIEADVYRDASWHERPVVVWIHGGALINGDREDVPDWLLEACSERGYVLVSIDYRLAPETKLVEIVRDIDDAFLWLREPGSRPFPKTSEIAVVGESAGGYLALTAGYRVHPHLAAVVSLWGYGDLIGPWYSEPSPHQRHHWLQLSSEEAHRQVSGPPLTDGRRREGDGEAFYQFCRQHGLWPNAVSGWDPEREQEKFLPLMPVANVTAQYPPTLLIHGVRDTDVPHDQSVHMDIELENHGVEHRLISVAGAEHGLEGVEQKVIDGAFREAAAFLGRNLHPS